MATCCFGLWLGACGPRGTLEGAAGEEPPDASGGARADGGGPGGGEVDAGGCSGADCTCVERPPAEGSCEHSLGGVYANGGCSGSYQCCDGVWENCTDCCGACTCTDTSGTEGCSPPGEGELECYPSFRGEAVAIPDSMRAQMIGRSWHEGLGCPSLDSLALLRMTHWGLDGEIHEGEMVVAAAVADDLLETFGRMYDARFPIERMVPVYNYEGDDDASMADNNTSAFNCRKVTGGSSLSQHSYGTAIDINPVQNPYVRNDTVLPEAGRAYLDRTDVRPGMIVRPGPVLSAFAALGWGWGGDFDSFEDYQHVSESGG